MTEYNRLTNKDWKENYDIFEDVCCDTCAEDCGECERNFNALVRLAELEDKIENGTLVELPCKAGDTVYVNEDTWKDGIFFNHTYIERKFFVIGKVTSVRITKNQILIRIKSNYQNNLYRYKTSNYPISAFGKTIFLTKAEAEARLKELQEEQE